MVVLYVFYLAWGAFADAPAFRVQLFGEPSTLDPVLNRGANGNYLFHALYRGLYTYRGDEGLRPDGAKRCVRHPKHLRCELNQTVHFSNGHAVSATDYVLAFRRVADPRVASPHADLVSSLVAAAEIARGVRPVEDLGVSAIDDRTLEFRFARDDPEFEYRLIHPALTPHPPGGFPDRARAKELVSSGPYRIAEWPRDKPARLTGNPGRAGFSDRPPVEMVAIDDESSALNLFETGRLSLLRRLVATEIPRFRGRPEFIQVPQARFDYVGFGPDLKDQPGLRNALIRSVDYPQFLKIFDTRTPPGCLSLPARYLPRPECLSFHPEDLPKAREVAKGFKADFFFSRLGGDDVHRAAEWFAMEWSKNLGAKLNLRSEEQGLFLARLRTRAPAVFRKGVGLDRPTCLAALELFETNNPDNYLKLNDPAFNRAVNDLRSARGESQRRARCRAAVAALLATRRLIPLGEMHFTLLVDPNFSGWDLSEINHLDLSRLSYRPKVVVPPAPTGPPKAGSMNRRRYGHTRRTSMSTKNQSENPLTVCCAEKCGKKSDRLNFCPEHYAWFKEGLINKKGVRPSDFDKKFQAYSLRHKKTA